MSSVYHDPTLDWHKEEVDKNPTDPFLLASYAYYLHADQQSNEALKVLDRALEIDPNYEKASYLKGVIYLALEDFEKGWPLFAKPGFWDGEDTTERLTIYQDQGFGDFFQFARWIPFVQQRCHNLEIACRPEMIDLLRFSFEGVNITTRLDNPLRCPITNLGYVFKTIPKEVPYLKTNKTSNIKAKIGICWTTENIHTETFLSNAIQDYDIKPIFERFDTISLLRKDLNNAQFAEQAAIINNLDLIISTETSIAHLSGALGKSTWFLLAHDWRWGKQQLNKIWYPTAKQFRQKEPGNWKDVIDEVIKELE